MNLDHHSEIFRIVNAVLDVWPEHERFLRKRFCASADGEMVFIKELASKVMMICENDLPGFAAGYRWMCQAINAAELHFRRTGNYPYSRFSEVNQSLYQDPETMGLYLKGILLSLVLWANHTRAMACFRHEFLGNHAPGYRHLEIGPGHGLLLGLAAMDSRCAGASGWDISPASIQLTRNSLRQMGIQRPVDLVLENIMAMESKPCDFDSITVSEVLEHLEQPEAALTKVRALLHPRGRAFFNIPVNSPAPDHITLFRTPEEVVALVENTGFDIESFRCFPATGFDLERARKLKTTISVVLITRRAG